MILFSDKSLYSDIKQLWSEVFGDSDEMIDFFLNAFGQYIVVSCENNALMGMMTLLPVGRKGKKGRYVYAVATGTRFRNRGVSTQLLEFAKKYIKANNEEFLVLVPADEGLFDFYAKRGFSPVNSTARHALETDGKNTGIYSIVKSDSAEYYALRSDFFRSSELIEWSIEFLDKIKEMYNGEYIKVYKNNEYAAAAFCVKNGGLLQISELLVSENAEETAKAIGEYFDVKKADCVLPDMSAKASAMIYPKIDNVYFNIALN